MSAFFLFSTQRIASELPGAYRAYVAALSGKTPLSYGQWAIEQHADEAMLTDDVKRVPGSWHYHQQYVEIK